MRRSAPARSRMVLWLLGPVLVAVLASSWGASFHALSWVGELMEISPGWVFAIAADATIAGGIIGLVCLVDRGVRLTACLWGAIGAGTVTSVVGNIAHVASSGPVNGWHLAGGAMPPVFLALMIEITLLSVRLVWPRVGAIALTVTRDQQAPERDQAGARRQSVRQAIKRRGGGGARQAVAQAISHLEAEGQPVTSAAISKLSGYSASRARAVRAELASAEGPHLVPEVAAVEQRRR